MSRDFLTAGAILIAGMALGLGAGAWWWRGSADRAADGRGAVMARPMPPPGPVRQAGGVGAGGDGVAGASAQADRLAGLAAKFRAMKDAKEEGLSMHVDAMVGLAGLTSDDFARLLGQLAEPKLDLDVAALPLIRWASVDPKAALAFALSRDEIKTTERIIAVMVYEMAKTDLAAAKAALGRMDAEERRYSQRAIVRMLQQKDPVAAIAYAREIEDSDAERDVLKFWAKSDPLAAAAELGAGKPGQAAAVEAIAAALAAQDRAAFEAWAAGLSDPVGRAVARRAALALDTLADPKRAAGETAAWLAREPEANDSAGELPAHVAQRWWWAKAPPQEVADWAVSLPAGKARDAALREVGRLWVEQDAPAASEWLGTLPPSPGRDQGVRQLVWKVSKEAPDEAFAWAGTIQDSGLRNEVLGESVRAWARGDAAAAQAAVATLPPEQRGAMLEMIEKELAAKK